MAFRKLTPHIATILIVAALVITQQVWAAPLAARMAAPAGTSKTTIAYQGYLTDSADSPVNGALAIVFKLYSVESGGTALWSETQPAVPVADGLFSVLLGSVTPLTSSLIANNNDLWLGITVGSDTEMAPRDKLASAPYAMMADVPDGSITQYKLGNDSVTSAKIVDGAVSSSDTGFNYAASASKGGAATDLACTNCVSSGEIVDGQVATADLADNAVTSAKVTDGAVGNNDVGFNYAGSTSKAGAATDLACTNCVSNGEIQDGQVANADLADNAVTSAKITDGAVSSADVGFNFAGSASKGGAATNVACSDCVESGDIAAAAVKASELDPTAFNNLTMQTFDFSLGCRNDYGNGHAGCERHYDFTSAFPNKTLYVTASIHLAGNEIFWHWIPAGVYNVTRTGFDLGFVTYTDAGAVGWYNSNNTRVVGYAVGY